MISFPADDRFSARRGRFRLEAARCFRPVRAGGRLLTILCVSLAMFAVYIPLRAARRGRDARLRMAARWTRRWARWMAAVCGIEVSSSGPLPPPGALLAPNHTGYVDVLALGALLCCFFAPKAEAAQWPLIGPLIRASEQVTIVRRRGRSVLDAAQQIQRRLALGERVCIFLEGTSSGGGVLPFKPSLLEPALREGVPIVPLAIHYRIAEPYASVEDHVAFWKPEHALAPHLWRMLGLRGVQARVIFEAPLQAAEGECRRDFAGRLENTVRELYARAAAEA